MTETDVIEISREAISVMLWLAGPILALTLGVGLVVSLFQTVTHIQEMTLTFVPKMVTVFLATLFLAPYFLQHLTAFMEVIADRIISLGTG